MKACDMRCTNCEATLQHRVQAADAASSTVPEQMDGWDLISQVSSSDGRADQFLFIGHTSRGSASSNGVGIAGGGARTSVPAGRQSSSIGFLRPISKHCLCRRFLIGDEDARGEQKPEESRDSCKCVYLLNAAVLEGDNYVVVPEGASEGTAMCIGTL